jgi:hypothetical protein
MVSVCAGSESGVGFDIVETKVSLEINPTQKVDHEYNCIYSRMLKFNVLLQMKRNLRKRF